MPSQPHIIEDDLKIGWGSRVLMEHVSFEIDRGTTGTVVRMRRRLGSRVAT